jgi:ABC-type transport system involved in cytochrome bd biosynthesis fused ATPase/permease subunit
MFSATLRFNLDPFKRHTDDEIWEVLGRVDMKETVKTLPGKLEEGVAEGGENFSAGMVCMIWGGERGRGGGGRVQRNAREEKRRSIRVYS